MLIYYAAMENYTSTQLLNEPQPRIRGKFSRHPQQQYLQTLTRNGKRHCQSGSTLSLALSPTCNTDTLAGSGPPPPHLLCTPKHALAWAVSDAFILRQLSFCLLPTTRPERWPSWAPHLSPSFCNQVFLALMMIILPAKLEWGDLETIS